MRRRDLLGAAGWLGLLLTAPGCAAASDGAPTDPARAAQQVGGRLVQDRTERRPAAAATAVRHKLLPFSAALYRAALTGTENAVLSPYSIAATLGMLALGARGGTAMALTRALGADAATVSSWLGGGDAALADGVSSSAKDSFGQPASPIVVEPANVLFLRADTQLNPSYLRDLAVDYGAGVRQVDFAESTAARATINSWVAQKTRQLIPELLPDGFVTAATLLVLVNALYLKAAWANPFQSSTHTGEFTTGSGGRVAVSFMTRSNKMNYATGRGWQAVSIPFLGGLAMTVVVPDPGSFGRISAALDADLLTAATGGQEREVDLAIPAFTTDCSIDLLTPLRAMGLGELLTRPDLSGIAGTPGELFVGDAVHKARIAVDANGVEAAAATVVAIPLSGAPPAALRVDRPFLYLIHDADTVTPLFLGRVADPTG